MASCLVVEILEDLLEEEFLKLKFYLREEVPEGCKPIPQGRLEKTDVTGVVKLMKSFYGDKMVEVIVEIFQKIPRNDLIKKLEECPEQKKCVRTVQEKLKLSLKRKFDRIYEGVAKAGKHAVFRNIYTELYMTEGDCERINTEHEVRQIETATRTESTPDKAIDCNNIFISSAEKTPIRTVLTKGIAGIGKSVTVQKFILDWAEGNANQDIDFVFFLPFRGLNLIKDKCSLLELLQVFHPVMKEVKNIEYEHYKVLCIFDGLEESLNFNPRSRSIVSDVSKTSTVDVLLTNLIMGGLLPSARLWITSRPSAANQIPPELIHRVTEIRGFNDAQKEEYFRKRFGDQTLADRVIAHIRASGSLYIMCHMPVFCWMTATVLERLLCDDEKGEIPKSLTGMYSHFLLIQATIEHQKYQEGHELDSQKLLEAVKEIIVKLSQLAFLGINTASPVFDEEDLKRCEIDVTKYSVLSAVCTEIFKEEFVLHQKKVYCFVHLSLQEYLAALYVMHAFINKSFGALKPLFGENLPCNLSLEELHEKVIKKALQSKNGHLDLFLRFLLGLSLDSNQQLLQGLLAQTGSNVESIQKTIQHIKLLNEKDHSPESCINLLHCLSELNDDSLQREVQNYLSSGSSSGESISPAHCSALAYLLLVSGKDLDEFDLNAYNTSAEGQQRLVPAVKCCKTAKLGGCNLTENSLLLVGSALQSASSPLRELDLSNNSLGEPGVQLLCTGLRSPKCKLHTLRLGWCDLTEGCCDVLASVLRSPHSKLRDLELRDNELQDSGVTALSAGLEDPHCKLQRLGLSGCHVTERGCDSLASALSSNPSHLRELDLRYNHPGDSGVRALSAAKLDTLTLLTDQGGEVRLRPGLRKYGVSLSLDPNTVHKALCVSDGGRAVCWGPHQPHPDHPHRFSVYQQVLCTEGLSDRCYWEVEWEEQKGGLWPCVAVAYVSIDRKGRGDSRLFGNNVMSWSLRCSRQKCSALHAKLCTDIATAPSQRRVGVFLDWPAGTLSFYRVSEFGTHCLMHTFYARFTEPLYPGLKLNKGNSVLLCTLD